MRIAKYNEYVQYIKENINDTPETYISSLLTKLKRKIDGFFVETEEGDVEQMSQVGNRERKEKGGMSFKDLKLNLESSEISKYSKVYDNLKIIFSDVDARYDLIITIDLKEALPKDAEKDFSIDDIENCSIKFKKYDAETGELFGQIMKTVKVKDINEELLIDLKIELDDTFGNSDDEKLEIETEEEESEE
jgi:hypothetical protein